MPGEPATSDQPAPATDERRDSVGDADLVGGAAACPVCGGGNAPTAGRCAHCGLYLTPESAMRFGALPLAQFGATPWWVKLFALAVLIGGAALIGFAVVVGIAAALRGG